VIKVSYAISSLEKKGGTQVRQGKFCTITVEFSHYGEPVRVEVPANARLAGEG
jgi:hypothetical protein